MKKGILAWLLILLSFILGVLTFCGTIALACYTLGSEITSDGGVVIVVISLIFSSIMTGIMIGIIEER